MREIKFKFYNRKQNYTTKIPLKLHEISRGIDYNEWLPLQFADLHDRYDKEVYEGNVVAIYGGAEPIKREVLFKNGCFCVNMFGNYMELKYYISLSFYEVEIIGNKEDARLLGEKNA